MKTFKKIAALVLAAVMLLSLSACGMDLKLTTAILKLNKVESAHADVDAALNLSVNSPSLELDMDILGTITGGIDYSKEPLEAAADLTVNAMGEELNILALLEDVDGSAVISYSVDGGQTWESAELGELDVNLEIDPIELLENLGEAGDLVSDFTPVGAELVNGAEATRYDSALNGAALGALVEETGAEEIAEASLDMDMDMDFSGMQDVKLSVWVDNASGLPVQASIDMADAIQSIVDASLGEILAASGMTGEEGSDLSVALSQM